jgi:hypothetical protein
MARPVGDPTQPGITVEANPMPLFRDGHPKAAADGDHPVKTMHLLVGGGAGRN